MLRGVNGIQSTVAFMMQKNIQTVQEVVLMADEIQEGGADVEKSAIKELDWIRKFNWALSTMSRAAICYFMKRFQ